VGGYGRQELYPYSDIDVLILIDSGEETSCKAHIEQFVHQAWNSGITLSHSVRTPAQCVIAAKSDLSTETSLLDARFLKGDVKLFQRMSYLYNIALIGRLFFRQNRRAKKRHLRFDETPYKLEPNIKESPGGLS